MWAFPPNFIRHFELLKGEDQLYMKNLFELIKNDSMTIIIIAITNNNDVFHQIDAIIQEKNIFKIIKF
jgi:hypothetical protein